MNDIKIKLKIEINFHSVYIKDFCFGIKNQSKIIFINSKYYFIPTK
jgi:hypothetical protein